MKLYILVSHKTHSITDEKKIYRTLYENRQRSKSTIKFHEIIQIIVYINIDIKLNYYIL